MVRKTNLTIDIHGFEVIWGHGAPIVDNAGVMPALERMLRLFASCNLSLRSSGFIMQHNSTAAPTIWQCDDVSLWPVELSQVDEPGITNPIYLLRYEIQYTNGNGDISVVYKSAMDTYPLTVLPLRLDNQQPIVNMAEIRHGRIYPNARGSWLHVTYGDAEEVSICINPSTNKYHVALNNKMLSIPEMPSDICEIVRFITSYSKTIYE